MYSSFGSYYTNKKPDFNEVSNRLTEPKENNESYRSSSSSFQVENFVRQSFENDQNFNSNYLSSIDSRLLEINNRNSDSLDSKEFSPSKPINNHENMLLNKSTHECPHCSFSTVYAKNLVRHIETRHSQNATPPPSILEFRCDICSQEFSTSNLLIEHENQAHPQTEFYRCSECSRAFKTKMNLKYHMDLHNPRKPYVCDIDGCERAFRTPKYLKNHQDEFHKLQPKQYSCPSEGCTEIFSRKIQLKRHITSHETVRWECPWKGCTFRALIKGLVSEHYRSSHPPFERFHRCMFCAFTHQDQVALQTHYRSDHPLECVTRSLDELFARYDTPSMPEPLEVTIKDFYLSGFTPSVNDSSCEEEEESETMSNSSNDVFIPETLLPNVIAILDKTLDPTISSTELEQLHSRALSMLPPIATGSCLTRQINEVADEIQRKLDSESIGIDYLENLLQKSCSNLKEEDFHVIELVEHQLNTGIDLTVPYPPRKRGRRPKIQQQLRVHLEKLYKVDSIVADLLSTHLIQIQANHNNSKKTSRLGGENLSKKSELTSQTLNTKNHLGGPASVSSTGSSQMITSPKSTSQLPSMSTLTGSISELNSCHQMNPILSGNQIVPYQRDSGSSGYCSSSNDSHSVPTNQLHSPRAGSISSDSPPRAAPIPYLTSSTTAESSVDHLQFLSALGAKYTQPSSSFLDSLYNSANPHQTAESRLISNDLLQNDLAEQITKSSVWEKRSAGFFDSVNENSKPINYQRSTSFTSSSTSFANNLVETMKERENGFFENTSTFNRFAGNSLESYNSFRRQDITASGYLDTRNDAQQFAFNNFYNPTTFGCQNNYEDYHTANYNNDITSTQYYGGYSPSYQSTGLNFSSYDSYQFFKAKAVDQSSTAPQPNSYHERYY